MPAKLREWKEIAAEHFSPAELAEIREAAVKESIELDLKALREKLGLTQVQAAALFEMTQPELSRFERREDHLLSSLRRYVNSLGGTLKIVAEINNQTVTLAEG